MLGFTITEVSSNIQCWKAKYKQESQIKPDQEKAYSPSVELDPVSQLGELVREAPLLDDALGADGHLAQGIGLRGSCQVELVDSMTHHLLCCSVFADDDVTALLIRFENSYHLIWNI